MKEEKSSRALFALGTSWLAMAKKLVRTLIMKIFWLVMIPLLRRKGRGSQIKITCLRNDGAGAQVQGRYSVRTLATLLGYKYLESPISGQLQENEYLNDPGKIAKWNQILAPFDSSDGDSVKVNGPWDFCKKILLNRGDSAAIFELAHGHFLTDYFPESLTMHQEDFRDRVERAISKWGLKGTNNTEPIVMHLRRGLMNESDTFRFTSNDEVFRHIDILRERYPSKRVRIYSYQEDKTLAASLPDWVTMDSNPDEFVVFAHCCKAEVFLMAKSSFSYIAAIANPNTVLYQEFWHPPLSNWAKV